MTFTQALLWQNHLLHIMNSFLSSPRTTAHCLYSTTDLVCVSYIITSFSPAQEGTESTAAFELLKKVWNAIVVVAARGWCRRWCWRADRLHYCVFLSL
jgi:hypothetical protein